MKKVVKFKTFITYALVLILLSSIIVFPDYVHGRNNSKDMVAIKTFNGKYLCAENGGGSTLIANRDQVGAWETFQIIDLGKGYIALKSHNGYYISAYNDGEDIYVNDNKIDKRQTFQLIKLDNNKVAFKNYEKDYISAENGGGGKLVGDKKKIGNWETFELIKLPELTSDKSILTATPNDKNVIFNWNKPTNAENIIGYNLYRGTEPGKQSATPITDFPIEGTYYTDNNLNSGTTYYYVLKPVYKDKTLGVASNEVLVLLKSTISLSAKTQDIGVNLSWNKPTNSSNVIGYNLYRGTEPGKQSSTPITDFPIEGTSYTDKNIENDTIYYYILKTVYKDKTLGEATNEVAVKSGPNNKNIVLELGSKHMFINGQKQEIDPGKGTVMIIKNGRTFLPIRAVIEAMGGIVEWNQSDKRVSVYLNNNIIHLWIGNKIANVNGVNMESDVAPYLSNTGRTMLPLRFIIEKLNSDVEWDGVTKRVTIKLKN